MSMNKWTASIIALVWVLAACTTAGQPVNAPGAVVQSTPESTLELMLNEALQSDAVEYAEQFGVSQDEAVRRLLIQNEIGGLSAALQRGEAETFAGLWIQHEPEFRLIAAFTRDGEQTIQPYLEGKSYAELVEVKTFPYSLRELETAQQQAIRIAEELGISITSYISVQENRVTIVVGNPEMFQEEVRSAGKELPEPVEVVAIDPGRLTDTLRGGVETYQGPDGGMIYFPRQAPTNVYMEALLEGTLILDPNGCLRVESEGGEARLVLWHHDFALQVEGDVVEIMNGEGQVVARVGEAIRMGGGETSASDIPGLPLANCPGPYWVLGDIEPLEAQAIPTLAPTQLPAWRQDELLIGTQVMSFSQDPLCEWDILGMEGRELYAWVYCEDQGEYGSKASLPAVIIVGEDGQYETVLIPGDGSNYCRDMLDLFPPEIRQAMQAYSHGKVDELIARAEARKAQNAPPQLYLTGTPRPEDLVYPTLTPYPTQAPLPPGLAGGYEPWLAYAGVDGKIYIAGGETLEPKAIDVWDACVPGAFPLIWSPDGRFLAYPNPDEGPEPQLAIYDRTTGAIERYPIPPLRAYPTWSPDSQTLAWAQVEPDSTNYALAPQSGGYRAVDVRTVYTLSRRSGEVRKIDEGQRVWWTADGALLYLKTDGSLWRSGPGGEDKKKIDLPILKVLDSNQLAALEYDAGLQGYVFGEPGLAGEGLKISLVPLDGSPVRELVRLDGFPEMIMQAYAIKVSPNATSTLVNISIGKPGEGGALTKSYQIRLADGQATEIQTFSGADWLPDGQGFAGLDFEDMVIYLVIADSSEPERVQRALRLAREAIALGVDARHVYGVGWVWVEK